MYTLHLLFTHNTMKQLPIITLGFILLSYTATAQKGWAFLKGEPSFIQTVEGLQGVSAPTNTPGLRTDAAVWSLNGKLYLYGGVAYLGGEDMWMFDTSTRNWTFLKGSTSNGVLPVYGTKGIPAANVTPGSRTKALTWVLNNKLYLFGGNGKLGSFDDLWSYDPNTNLWTWLSGNVGNINPVFGTQGVPAASNKPGWVEDAITWVHNGKLYFYGGRGNQSGSVYMLNDIWEYDPGTQLWTWVKGMPANLPTYWGTKNTPGSLNIPSKIHRPKSGWYINNKLYLHHQQGGCIWEYDHATNNWTWRSGNSQQNLPVYGTKGVADTLNTPGGVRLGTLKWTSGGKAYLYGGYGYVAGKTGQFYRNDLWELDLSNFTWTWIGGDTTGDNNPTYGVLNYYHKDVWPGDRGYSNVWSLGDKVYTMSTASTPENSDAIFEFNNTSRLFRWISGMHNAYSNDYYVKPHLGNVLNEPYASYYSNIWHNNDTVYLSGTDNYKLKSKKPKNILWRYSIDKNEWTVEQIRNSIDPFYGVKGTTSVQNSPGFRSHSYTWYLNGKLYQYSGFKHDPDGSNLIATNDLWEYDIQSGLWKWLHGDSAINSGTHFKTFPIYGTSGVAAAANTPGGRTAGLSWVTNGKLYLFGGSGEESGGLYDGNDVWEYNPATNMWTWLKGAGTTFHGFYGTKGVAAAANTPGNRTGMAGCSLNGKFYLFGGVTHLQNSYNEFANDLWEYDPGTNMWTWISGSSAPLAPSVFGTKFVPAATNTPGRREYPTMWAGNNRLYLMGGWSFHGASPLSPHHISDDLWEYNISTKNWTWIGGSDTLQAYGSYLKELTVDSTNTPGAGWYSNGWSHNNFLYLIGGYRYPANRLNSTYGHQITNSIWAYRLCDVPTACYTNAPAINIDSVLVLCDDKLLTVNAGNTGSSYIWSTGDTSQNIGISVPGKYWVKVTNPANLATTDTFIVLAGTSPNIALGNDTSFCANEQFTLNISTPGAKTYWSNNDTGTQIRINTAGLYSVLVIDTNGCYAEDEIYLDTLSAPSIPDLTGKTMLCSGDSLYIYDNSNTVRHAILYGPNGFLDTGIRHTLFNINLSDSGLYYIVDTLNACSSSDSILIDVDTSFTPTISMTISPAGNIWQYVQITFTSTVNYTTANTYYEWFKNGVLIPGANNPQYSSIAETDIHENDVICVVVHDSSRCATKDSARACSSPIKISTSVKDMETVSNQIQIYPNPATNEIWVTIPPDEINASVLIMDITGKTFKEVSLSERTTVIDIKHLPKGIFLAKYSSSKNTHVVKVSKE